MSLTYGIPFNRPGLIGSEQEYISQAIQNGHISGDGVFTKKCEQLLEALLSVPKVLLTTSCTHALEMSALLCDIKAGDEVIVPSFTFVSTVNAFVLRGATPVFADIRPDTLNIDDRQLPELITERTKAIVPVHYAGVGCAMDSIMSLAERNELSVIEDNAHGLLGKYTGRHLGTFGRLATLSFHETKNFSCGEGGALLVNDLSLIERAEIIREKGTNRSRFFRGQIDKYTWVDIGSSYVLSDLLAAFLLANLEQHEKIQGLRKRIWTYYYTALAGWAERNDVIFPVIPDSCTQSYHMFFMLLPSLKARQALMDHLRKRGILAVYHYLPLHQSEMGKRYGRTPLPCLVTESVSDRILRLPFFNFLSLNEQQLVVEALLEFST